MNDPLPLVKISRKAEERIRCGHLWVFGDDLREVPPRLPHGQWVLVTSRAGEILGPPPATSRAGSRFGWSRTARCALRRRFSKRGSARRYAGERRRDWGGLEALRLVYSEGDFLPGLVVDRPSPSPGREGKGRSGDTGTSTGSACPFWHPAGSSPPLLARNWSIWPNGMRRSGTRLPTPVWRFTSSPKGDSPPTTRSFSGCPKRNISNLPCYA
jgi:hypothetical protein